MTGLRRSQCGLGRSQDYPRTRLDTLVVDGRHVAPHAQPLLLQRILDDCKLGALQADEHHVGEGDGGRGQGRGR